MVKGMMERVKWKTWHNHEKRPPHPAGQWSRRLKSGHVRGPRKVGWKSVEIYGGSGGHVIQFFSCCDFLGRRCWFFRPAMVISVQLWQFVIRICLVACSFHLPGFFSPQSLYFLFILFLAHYCHFFLVVPPSEHLLKLPDWQQRHFLNGSPGSCRMISGVHEGSARTSSRFHCLPAFLWVYPGN